MIIAKPVINKKYWILKKDDRKVGVVEADADGVKVRIQDRVARFKTLPMIRKQIDIEFQPPERTTKPQPDVVYGYDAGCRAHNPLWDVRHRLPLFTKTAKSKSWFAAGWYAVKQARNWKVCRNPKLILLERYPYRGPFHSREEANDQSI